MPPSKQITPAAMVRECRDWLQTVGTRRPFTPRLGARGLFVHPKHPNSRPPTASTMVSINGELTQAGSEEAAKRDYAGDLLEETSTTRAKLPLPRTLSFGRCRPRVLSPIRCKESMKIDGISCKSLAAGKAVQPFAQPPSRHTEEAVDELLNSLNGAISKLGSIDRSGVNHGGVNASVIVKKVFMLLDEVCELVTDNSFTHSTNKLKDKIMQTLLQATTLRNPRINIRVVDLGIMLGLKGANLVKICKIFYRTAKEARNDELFLQDKDFVGLIVCHLNGFGLDSAVSLENLGSAQMLTTLESLLYTCGALKFLTASAVTREALCTPDLLRLLVGIHQALDSYDCMLSPSSDGDGDDSLRETIHHVLLQITEVFCAASATETSDCLKMRIVETGVLQIVLKSILRRTLDSPSIDFSQILLNWARTIAHATEHSFVCQLFGENGTSLHCRDLVEPILLHKDQIDFVLRLAYALGNVAECCESAGKNIFPSEESIAKICALCEENAAALLNIPAKSNSLTYDLLVKLTRVIANASVGTEGGLLAANTPECTSMLLRLLKISTTTESTNNELLNNTLAGLNNITFYMTTKKETELLPLQIDVGQECIQLLNRFPHIEEISLNIIRVLGNLTRSTDIRASIVTTISSNLDDPCLIERFWSLLKSSDEIVYSTLGVLVNLMLEPTFLSVFCQRDGLQKMVDVMCVYAGLNWQTAALAGKVMCNFIVFVDSVSDVEKGSGGHLNSNTSAKLELLLRQLIDEEAVKQMFEGVRIGLTTGDGDRETQAERDKRRQRSDKISSLLGQYLLKGWRMLEDCCPVCDTILLMSRDGALYCVGCSEVDTQPSQVVEMSKIDTMKLNEKSPHSKNPSNDDPGASPSPRKLAATVGKSGLSINASFESSNNLQSVESILHSKIVDCSQLLAKTADLEEIRRLAVSIKALSEAFIVVRTCSHS
ncbi:Armadillo repeat-containing protein 2 [Taenia crassiceps]|uniref:Armadillo repeat-containing protein 2 n=1 Tax=Taenia crassiceps TaxID=6207 RepID=A0ABR4Q623_9CEST